MNPSVFISIDRRANVYDELIEEIESLAESVIGLGWSRLNLSTKDAGKFRDFSPVVEVSHESSDALLVVINELVDTFGWKIDVSKPANLK